MVERLNNFSVSYGDILMLGNQAYVVHGGDRKRDRYAHYIYQNGKEIYIESINPSEITKIIRRTCFIDNHRENRDIYEGDKYEITLRDNEEHSFVATVVVDTEKYPYYNFLLENGQLLPMYKCNRKRLIFSEADQFLNKKIC